MRLRKGRLKEATELMVACLEEEILRKEVELESLKKEQKMLTTKLEQEEQK